MTDRQPKPNKCICNTPCPAKEHNYPPIEVDPLEEAFTYTTEQRDKYKALADQHYHRYQEALKEIGELKLKNHALEDLNKTLQHNKHGN